MVFYFSLLKICIFIIKLNLECFSSSRNSEKISKIINPHSIKVNIIDSKNEEDFSSSNINYIMFSKIYH